LVCAQPMATLASAPDPTTKRSKRPDTPPDKKSATPAPTQPELLIRAGLDAGQSATVPTADVLTMGFGAAAQPLTIEPGATVSMAADLKPAHLHATGRWAPGIQGLIGAARPRAASQCTTPATEQWFAAAGADATHASDVELVNPDSANAVADLTVFGEQGLIDAPQLRGVAVPGESTVRLSLAELIPQRGMLGISAVVSRGRLGVFLVDTSDELGSGAVHREWIPPQSAPATTNHLLGLPTGTAKHKLVLVNPGSAQTRVSLKVATGTSTYSPVGAEEVQIPPKSLVTVNLTDALSGAADQGVAGLVVTATEPVVAGLRSLGPNGDLSMSGSDPAIKQGSVLVPTLATKDVAALVLQGSASAATVQLQMFNGAGKLLSERGVEISPDATATVALPVGVRAISLQSLTAFAGALAVSGPDGSAILPITQPVSTELVPQVRSAVR
jgi:Family of unknown function (DUF5719)